MCTLFGIVNKRGNGNPNQNIEIFRKLGIAGEEYGTDATGIGYKRDGELIIKKMPLAAHEAFKKIHIPTRVKILIGHTRWMTSGSYLDNKNNHPFNHSEKFLSTHNGVLKNYKYLKYINKLQTSIDTDSYVFGELLGGDISNNNILKTLKKLKGTYSFALLSNENELVLIKGCRPLNLYYNKVTKTFIYCSRHYMFEQSIQNRKDWIRFNFNEGTIVRIDINQGIHGVKFFEIENNYLMPIAYRGG